MATYTDNFNRSDSASLGANWSALLGSWKIVSNRAAPGSGGDCMSLWAGGSVGNDHYSQAYAAVVSSDAYTGLGVRMSSGKAYAWQMSSSGGEYFFANGAGYVEFGARSTVVVSTDTVKLEANGNSITCYLNGAPTFGGTVTDSSIPTGGVGLYGFDSASSSAYDNWEGGDIGGGGGGTDQPASLRGLQVPGLRQWTPKSGRFF